MIHPTAIVSKKAKLGNDVGIGAYTLVGDNVSIGDGTTIGAHCVIDGNTAIGKACTFFTGVVAGSRPQDLKYKGETSFLEIGDNNIIREYSTLNLGTGEGGKTIVGSNNLIMAYSHVAHDCRVGSDCVIANNGTLAGHVTIGDKVVVGGLVAIHQFVRIGMLSIIGGCSKVVQDIPPYSTCDGHPARVYGLNLIGLRRHGISKESIHALNHAFKTLFNSGLSPKHALEALEKDGRLCKEVAFLAEFMKSSERGVAHSCRVS
ncbi:MAG: acyl-ACP--UDP-N-acetylglucosamine O-acyltransferase [Candidatus Omnitrophica bacterium]|nr:acyl-ACP--UDP-N-acetylglucosamine O-acyltransferase [Candidatus Omnitrophota bacterium]